MSIFPQEEASYDTMEEPLIDQKNTDEPVIAQVNYNLKMKQNGVTYSQAAFGIGFLTASLAQFAVSGVRFLLQMRRYNKIELGKFPMEEILRASMVWSLSIAVLVVTVYYLLNRAVVSMVQLLIGSDARNSHKFGPFVKMLGRMHHRFIAGGITGVCSAFMVDVTILDETQLIPMILLVLMIGLGSLHMFTKYERYVNVECHPVATDSDGDHVNATIPEVKSPQQQKEEHGKSYEVVQIV